MALENSIFAIFNSPQYNVCIFIKGDFKFNYHKNVTIIFSIVVRLKLFFGKMNSSKANS